MKKVEIDPGKQTELRGNQRKFVLQEVPADTNFVEIRASCGNSWKGSEGNFRVEADELLNKDELVNTALGLQGEEIELTLRWPMEHTTVEVGGTETIKDRTLKVLEEIQKEWEDNKIFHTMRRDVIRMKEGIRSSQISALVMYLIRKGVL